jgi:uncharacterized lipoprotein YmbA
MTPKIHAAWRCLLVLAVLVAGGCSLLNPGPQLKTRFYMLSSLAASGKAVQPLAALPHVAIGIGPVRLPEYLDRRNIVVRTSRNEFELTEDSQWAEPMGDTVSRVLADNLSALLGTYRIAQFPWRSSMPVDYQLTVQVAQFDGMPGEMVILRAHWQVFTGDGKKLLDSGYSVFREKAEDTSIEALVSAESRAAESFSREVAETIARLAK